MRTSGYSTRLKDNKCTTINFTTIVATFLDIANVETHRLKPMSLLIYVVASLAVLRVVKYRRRNEETAGPSLGRPCGLSVV